MPTARLLTGRPLVEIDADGLRVLARDLAVDLGCIVPELHDWRAAHPEHGRLVSMSEAVSTVIRVAAGFRYDGASLPFFALPILGPKEGFEVAGVVHDACYRFQVGRAVADRVFWIVARSGSRQVGPVRGFIGWLGLRVGGWVAYRRNAD